MLLHALWPLPWPADIIGARILGGCLLLGGSALSGAVVYQFRRAETPVTPRRETRRLVLTGPYRFSRNPDYVGQAMVVGGLGLLLAVAWIFLTLALALVLVRYGVIAREERYLERRFGESYRLYCSRVHRWL